MEDWPGPVVSARKTGIDNLRRRPVFHPLFRQTQVGRKAMLPGSSVAEQVTVNHLVAGSIPARAAILHQADAGFLDSPKKPLSGYCPILAPCLCPAYCQSSRIIWYVPWFITIQPAASSSCSFRLTRLSSTAARLLNIVLTCSGTPAALSVAYRTDLVGPA